MAQIHSYVSMQAHAQIIAVAFNQGCCLFCLLAALVWCSSEGGSNSREVSFWGNAVDLFAKKTLVLQPLLYMYIYVSFLSSLYTLGMLKITKPVGSDIMEIIKLQ